MKDTQNPSYSLLSQKEIDALVEFLTEKKTSVDSDVMNQESIDKLISLITNDSKRIIMDFFNPFANLDPALLSNLSFRNNINELCELQCSVDNETGFIKLTAYNTVNGQELVITPKLINKNDTENWGYSISPNLFNRLAIILSLKYSTETHDTVCNIFAKHTYGSEEYKIPDIYLPTNENLLLCLL